jgi:hypothetical protein
MKLFANTFAKRKTAVVVLLAWLFALASGVANACLLETSTTHAHFVTAAFEGARTSAVMAGHTGVVADSGDELPAAKAPCLKVCDESSNALATQLSMAQPDMGPAPLVRVVWLAAASDRVAPSETGDPGLPAPELPLRVRYSRLAL